MALLLDQTIGVQVGLYKIAQTALVPPAPLLNETFLTALIGAKRRSRTMSSNGFLLPSQE